MARSVLLVAVSAALAIAIAPNVAWADSATVSVSVAGNGQLAVSYTVSSSTCTTIGFCGWFAYGYERHASLPCRDDQVFLRWVVPFQDTSGSYSGTATIRPFFPRRTKICVAISNADGSDPQIEGAVVNLPAGYGVQGFTYDYDCDNFAYQAQAQYFYKLYPADPSGLDADNDGSACEENPCPCGAESIPAEPQPAPPAPPPPPPPVCSDGEDNDLDGLTDTEDPGCSSSADGSERDPVWRLSLSKAETLAREALATEFGRYFTGRQRSPRRFALHLDCWDRRSAGTIACGPQWFWPRDPSAPRWRAYMGSVVLRRVSATDYRYWLRIRRTLYPHGGSQVVKRRGVL